MSIRLNQMTRGKMNCIFLLEVNKMPAFTYPYQVASLIARICTEISPSIDLPIHCNHSADSREMKLEAPCTSSCPNTGPAIPLWGVFFDHLEEARALTVFPVSKGPQPSHRGGKPSRGELGRPSTRPPELLSPWDR